MGGTSPCAGSYAIYLPCHAVQRGERLYCVARKLGRRPSAALIGAPPCSVPQRASAAPHSSQVRGRACAVGASASLVRAAFLFCHQLRSVFHRSMCNAPPSRGLFSSLARWRRLAGVRLTARCSLSIATQHRQSTPAIDRGTRIII